MNIRGIRSDHVYQKMIAASIEKRNDIYRYELMKPFEKKLEIYRIPLKAKQENGYDVIMASTMLGYLAPEKIDESQQDNVALLSQDNFWQTCQKAIEDGLGRFEKAGISLPIQEYLYTIMLADPKSPYTILSDGYSGDGGIPGYIWGAIYPNTFTLDRMPAALAHECNHNVRFQFIEWRDDITLAEMMISEGLAENYATSIYGKEKLGPWVSKVSMESLKEYIKPLIKEALDVSGMENLTAYLYGDEIAEMNNYFPVGLPFCAGYACGYYMIEHYLQKTGKTITEATILPSEEILAEITDFWEE
ncbi:DUF2268 domain-containing protein [Enterococcus pallens]|uniref:DUF2268 domain-containing protein n=1 Tax=Enterococcus pallens ATCC BAA-351 TaxID=1158607 RepID=R2Q5S8_9ENTE|nr:DUF2268 domain-containing protein [Enterococcus pallens]EOH91882.1 hypothetical protein UAU_03184 [Enterococcus pallens ATCC BAA-351]EOU25309.1 hypothetical protein I588_01297 [Enterococcus pallens ATCC BAA-351]